MILTLLLASDCLFLSLTSQNIHPSDSCQKLQFWTLCSPTLNQKFQELCIGAVLKRQANIPLDIFKFFLKIIPDYVSLVLFVEVGIYAYTKRFYERLIFELMGAVVEKPSTSWLLPLYEVFWV